MPTTLGYTIHDAINQLSLIKSEGTELRKDQTTLCPERSAFEFMDHGGVPMRQRWPPLAKPRVPRWQTACRGLGPWTPASGRSGLHRELQARPSPCGAMPEIT